MNRVLRHISNLVLLTSVMLCGATAFAQDRARGRVGGNEWVDLGLSVKWASCNVGAAKPSDSGFYFAWGETSARTMFEQGRCKTYGKNIGNIANLREYDAAMSKWGGPWRMPTDRDLCELREKCVWTWTVEDGQSGYKVTGPNGNSIFLPATGGSCEIGEGGYWSSVPNGDNRCEAYAMMFTQDACATRLADRSDGFCVRAVASSPRDVPVGELANELLAYNSKSAGGIVVVDGDSVYSNVDEMPKYPGGEIALMAYIVGKIRYPEEAQGLNKNCKVVVKFVVKSDGSIDNVRVIRGQHPALDREAVRVVESLPDFIPGKLNGEPVDVWYTLPIPFNCNNL